MILNMKKVLFAVFAHPDDEAFGPSGFLIQQAKQGVEIHLICVTDGAAGEGSPSQRSEELQNASKLIGASSLSQLNFPDGGLSNNNLQDVTDAISKVIEQKIAEKTCQIDFLTFDLNGISGHLDHIAVSLATTYIYTHFDFKLSEKGTLRYFCLCSEQKSEDLDYFVYSPCGHPENAIDETVDVGDIIDIKKQVIAAHPSQASDVKLALERGDKLNTEHFMIYR
jgi:LmbE family N-acetylglucosaminyl deacetylase